jgi:hypothetical protein
MLWRKPINWCQKYVAIGHNSYGAFAAAAVVQEYFSVQAKHSHHYFLFNFGRDDTLDCQLLLCLFFVSCSSYMNGVVQCIMYLSHKQ